MDKCYDKLFCLNYINLLENYLIKIRKYFVIAHSVLYYQNLNLAR